MHRALSERQILASLTTNPAQYFKAAKKGRVEKGFDADLVVLDGDPMADVTQPRQGRLHDPRRQGHLSEAVTAAEPGHPRLPPEPASQDVAATASSALFASAVIVLSGLDLSPNGGKPNTRCANCSMKSPDIRRSIRRRRCGAPRARPQRKRFYKEAGVAEADGGFAVTLDGKPIRTPSGRQVVAPTREIAEAIAAEWKAQGETIDPLTMPLTRFANSVVEVVVDRVDAVADDVAKYLGSDLLFYRAGHPEALVAREAAHWDPIAVLGRRRARRAFHPGRGHRACRPAGAGDQGGARRFPADPWSVAALHVVTTLTGSALLALALLHGVRDPDQVWAAAHVDEDWNIEKWGVDEEVAARRAARLVDFRAAGEHPEGSAVAQRG